MVNRYLKNSQLTLRDAEESLGHSVFWHFPNDFSNTLAAINQGKVLSVIAPKAEITKSFRKLAATFIDRDQKAPEKESGFVKRWFS